MACVQIMQSLFRSNATGVQASCNWVFRANAIRCADQCVFSLRLPTHLHKRLADSAKSNNRSLNAEMLQALEAYIDGFDRLEVLTLANIELCHRLGGIPSASSALSSQRAAQE